MKPLDQVLYNALEFMELQGVSRDDAVKILLADIDTKQNKYKWRKKLQNIESNPVSYHSPNAINFLDELNI